MKRLLSLTMAGMLLFSTTAFAMTVDEAVAETGLTAFEPTTAGNFDVTYSDATEEDNEYMIWVLKGVETAASAVSFAQANVMYVDQVTATSSGAAFSGFLPMKSVDSTVVITGQGMEAPVIIGYIEADGNPISGNICLYGWSGDLHGVTVTLTSTTDPSVVYTTTPAIDGSFTLEGVKEGTYALSVVKQYYLTHSAAAFPVEGTTETGAITLMPGDVDESGGIGRGDLTIFRAAYTNTESVDTKCDFDGSGGIGRGDLTIFRTSWNQAS